MSRAPRYSSCACNFQLSHLTHTASHAVSLIRSYQQTVELCSDSCKNPRRHIALQLGSTMVATPGCSLHITPTAAALYHFHTSTQAL
jgi:hypothetical protein